MTGDEEIRPRVPVTLTVPEEIHYNLCRLSNWTHKPLEEVAARLLVKATYAEALTEGTWKDR